MSQAAVRAGDAGMLFNCTEEWVHHRGHRGTLMERNEYLQRLRCGLPNARPYCCRLASPSRDSGGGCGYLGD